MTSAVQDNKNTLPSLASSSQSGNYRFSGERLKKVAFTTVKVGLGVILARVAYTQSPSFLASHSNQHFNGIEPSGIQPLSRITSHNILIPKNHEVSLRLKPSDEKSKPDASNKQNKQVIPNYKKLTFPYEEIKLDPLTNELTPNTKKKLLRNLAYWLKNIELRKLPFLIGEKHLSPEAHAVRKLIDEVISNPISFGLPELTITLMREEHELAHDKNMFYLQAALAPCSSMESMYTAIMKNDYEFPASILKIVAKSSILKNEHIVRSCFDDMNMRIHVPRLYGEKRDSGPFSNNEKISQEEQEMLQLMDTYNVDFKNQVNTPPWATYGSVAPHIFKKYMNDFLENIEAVFDVRVKLIKRSLHLLEKLILEKKIDVESAKILENFYVQSIELEGSELGIFVRDKIMQEYRDNLMYRNIEQGLLKSPVIAVMGNNHVSKISGFFKEDASV